MTIRQKIEEYDDNFHKLLNSVKENYIYNENDYIQLNEILNFIKQSTEKLDENILNKVIFLLGPTGSGKSTLICYLKNGDDAFNIGGETSDDDIQIKPNMGNEIEIGDGSGSTTLVPNIISTSFGNFVDFAGDGDTGGIIANIIISTIKQFISLNSKQVKILFVSKQSSLTSDGSYGKSLKESLVNNSTFLNNISHFDDSVGMVITKAGTSSKVMDMCESLLKKVTNHPDFRDYKFIIDNILNKNKFITFSKSSSNDRYLPPQDWNLNQRDNIIKFIEEIPYSEIPSNFFQISSTSEIREKMKNIFQILKFKSQNEIIKLLKKSKPLTIHSVELKSFNNFTSKLLNGSHNDLLSFIKLLQFNDFLNLKIDDSTQSMFKELSDNLNYLFQFTNEKPSCENFKCNWLDDCQDIKNIIFYLYNTTSTLLNKDGNNLFEKLFTNQLINVTPVTKDFSNEFKSLYNLYKNEYDLESLKNNNQSKYYCKEVVNKIFSHREEIHYLEKEKYEEIKKKIVDVPYYDTEVYYEPEKRIRETTNTKQVQYWEPQEEIVDVVKYREVNREIKKRGFWENAAFTIFTAGIGNAVKALGDGDPFLSSTEHEKKFIPYNVKEKKITQVEKFRDVEVKEKEEYTEMAKKTKQVQKKRQEEQEIIGIKEKFVPKTRFEDFYNEVITMEFDENLFNLDKQENEIEISKLRKIILDSLNFYKNGKAYKSCESIKCNDYFEEKYKDLKEIWQEVEYLQYFEKYPNNMLDL